MKNNTVHLFHYLGSISSLKISRKQGLDVLIPVEEFKSKGEGVKSKLMINVSTIFYRTYASPSRIFFRGPILVNFTYKLVILFIREKIKFCKTF